MPVRPNPSAAECDRSHSRSSAARSHSRSSAATASAASPFQERHIGETLRPPVAVADGAAPPALSHGPALSRRPASVAQARTVAQARSVVRPAGVMQVHAYTPPAVSR
ncbi:hypothetical protein GCM10010435_80100 [Winogradskya consettensis]|uniref:Uncharacterized protein n=1 Tax=Winogradskya consettensis TaxID=113560 RepID=A0A919SUM8_9ACTN|nr:hypothetical protein Aco04nite_54870 [Actinoplanes consettensis]